MKAIWDGLIIKAASLVLCSRLNSLYAICWTQETISTNKLKKELDKLQEYSINDAVFLRGVADKIPKPFKRFVQFTRAELEDLERLTAGTSLDWCQKLNAKFETALGIKTVSEKDGE